MQCPITMKRKLGILQMWLNPLSVPLTDLFKTVSETVKDFLLKRKKCFQIFFKKYQFAFTQWAETAGQTKAQSSQ